MNQTDETSSFGQPGVLNSVHTSQIRKSRIKIDPVRIVLTPKSVKTKEQDKLDDGFPSSEALKEEGITEINKKMVESRIRVEENNYNSLKKRAEAVQEKEKIDSNREEEQDHIAGVDIDEPSVISNFREKRVTMHVNNFEVQPRNAEEKKEQEEIEIIQEDVDRENENGLDETDRIPPQSRGNSEPVNQNTNEIPIAAPVENARPLTEEEAKLYLYKTIILFIAVVLVSIFMLLTIHTDFSYGASFLTVQTYLQILIFVDFVWTKKILGDYWGASGSDVKISNIVAFSISTFLVYLNVLNVLPVAVLAILPFTTLILASLLFSQDQIKKKIQTNLERVVYLLMILLVALKLDGIIKFDWMFIFILPCTLLWMRSFIIISHALFLIKAIGSTFTQRRQPNLANKLKIIGYLWCFMETSLNIIGIAALYGIRVAISENRKDNFEVLNITAWVAIAVTTIIVFYTVLLRKQLIRFIILVNLIPSLFAGIIFTEEKEVKEEITFSAEKKEDYFVMVSPTYYLPLKKSSIIKDEESLETMREMLKKLNSNKQKSQQTLFNRRTQKKHTSIFHRFRQFKEGFDKKLSERKNNLGYEKMKHNKQQKVYGTIVLDQEVHEKNHGENKIDQEKVEWTRKISFSLDNLNHVSKLRDDIISSKPKEQNNLCYVCYVNQPDTILFSCGHGGVCFECLCTMIKKKNECMECRKKPEGIYKINSTPAFPNIFKGIEFNKILVGIEDKIN